MAEEQRSNLEMEIVKLYSIVTKTPSLCTKKSSSNWCLSTYTLQGLRLERQLTHLSHFSWRGAHLCCWFPFGLHPPTEYILSSLSFSWDDTVHSSSPLMKGDSRKVFGLKLSFCKKKQFLISLNQLLKWMINFYIFFYSRQTLVSSQLLHRFLFPWVF